MKKLTKAEKVEKVRIAKIKSDFLATLHGPNIFSHIEEMQKMEDIHNRYFSIYSPVYKALVKYMMSTSNCVFFDENTNSKTFASHRGFYPIHVKHSFIYSGDFVKDKFVKSNQFCLIINVDLIEPENDHMEYPPEFNREVYISIPMDLELKFTQKKFDRWISDLTAKRDKERYKEDEEDFARLAKKLGKDI